MPGGSGSGRGALRKWLGRFGLLVGTTLAALIVADLVLRVLGIAPERYAQPRHLESADKRAGVDAYPDDPRDYFPLDLRDEVTRESLANSGIPDLDRHADRTPHAVPLAYTERLCRGTAVPDGDPSSTRILVVGDSFTEGQGVREEDTFAAVLDRRLAGAHVVNCGRRGYDFPDLRGWVEQHLDLEPDVLVYAMTLNDPERSESFHARQQYIDDWIVDRRRMVAEGDGAPSPFEPRLFALLSDRLEGVRVGAETTRWYQEMAGEPNREGFDATVRHITAMRDEMTTRGGEFVVVLWPLLVDLDGDDYPFTDVHRTIGNALRAEDVAFHDALPEFLGEDPEQLWVHATDRHPNERAHGRFAGLVERALEPALGTSRAERPR
jgi:lysophospholipase L1-like esterase